MKTGSICLSDIPKERITTAKNGKKYLAITVFENEQEDKFGNHESIQISRTKEERENNMKPMYIGNLKDWSKSNNQNTNTRTAEDIANSQSAQDENDDLPF